MAEQYTKADVQLVAEAIKANRLARGVDDDGEAFGRLLSPDELAPYVVDALVKAGRLLPEGLSALDARRQRMGVPTSEQWVKGHWVRTDRPEMLSDRLGYPPERGDMDWAIAEALALVSRRLVALASMNLGGLPYIGREQVFEAVNDAARESKVFDAYSEASRRAGPGPHGEALTPLELARRNGDVPGEDTTDG